MSEPNLLETFRADAAPVRDRVLMGARARLVAEMGRPSPPRRRDRRALRRALVLGTAVAAAALVIAQPWQTRAGGDDVARAAAALAPKPGTIIHVRSVGHRIYSPFSETWFVTGGGAWRNRHGGENANGPCTVETGFDPRTGIFSTWDASTQTIDVRSVPASTRGRDSPSDPTAQVRRFVAHGELHAAGHARIDGRDVIRLEPAAHGTVWMQATDGKLLGYSRYFVDARTFAPVRWQISSTQWYDFTIYERLPEDQATLALTRVRAQHPSAPVHAGGHGDCGSG
jgi:hypothetical protein